MSRINEVVEMASGLIVTTGSVAHFYDDCDRAGSVNAREKHNDQGEPYPACTACELNELARLIYESRGEQVRETGAFDG